MSTTPHDLEQRRELMNGTTKPGATKVESIIKFFMSEDKIAAIKAEDTRITIGTPPMQVSIKPMSPKLVADSYTLIRKLLLPILTVISMSQAGDNVPISAFLDAFGENIDALPELIFKILQRGNPDVTREWCDEHLDFLLDVQVILPIFLRQNGLDRLFAGKEVAPQIGAGAAVAEEKPAPPMGESPALLRSSADGTGDGLQTTSGMS